MRRTACHQEVPGEKSHLRHALCAYGEWLVKRHLQKQTTKHQSGEREMLCFLWPQCKASSANQDKDIGSFARKSSRKIRRKLIRVNFGRLPLSQLLCAHLRQHCRRESRDPNQLVECPYEVCSEKGLMLSRL